MKLRLLAAVLFVFSIYMTAFAQDGTAESNNGLFRETPVPTFTQVPLTIVATEEATPLAPVCEEGSTCNFNTGDSSGSTPPPSDPTRDFALVASGSLLTILVGGLSLYIGGARILRGLMSSVWFMAMAEYVYNEGKKRTPAPLQTEAKQATDTYGEFATRVTDGVPDILRSQTKEPTTPAPLMPPPASEVPTIPRRPPEPLE